MLERGQFTEDGDQSDRRFVCDDCGKEGPVFLESEWVEDVAGDSHQYGTWRVETADDPHDPRSQDLCPACQALPRNQQVEA